MNCTNKEIRFYRVMWVSPGFFK